MEKRRNHFRSSLGASALNHEVTVRILQNQTPLGCFICLSFVAIAVDRSSFKEKTWFTVTLVWEAFCCLGTVITNHGEEEAGDL